MLGGSTPPPCIFFGDVEVPHFKKLTAKHKEEIEQQVKRLLHASRDAMRNRHNKNGWETFDPNHLSYQVSDGYYGEAFGVFRTLEILGYGVLNANEQTYHNLKWWFNKLADEVLKEEGFHDKTHRCDYCVKTWGKDGAGRNRANLSAV